MIWLVFSYSLRSQRASSARVGLWRRLQNLGAFPLKNGLYVLPDREDCLEAFQWLAQEVQQTKGDATVMRVERFEGMSDSQLVELFQTASRKKYEKVDRHLTALEKIIGSRSKPEKLSILRRTMKKLQREYEDIGRTDFFESPHAMQINSRLRRIKQQLSGERSVARTELQPAAVTAYQDRRWVTRPRPHVDRLACIWLIRRFINPTAVIRYSNEPGPEEVRFDMRSAEFGHQGNLCTFETMLVRFGLADPALQPIAEIVHEIDLRDGLYSRPEASGVDMVLKGWLFNKLPDAELEAHGLALFQGLYMAFSRRLGRDG